MTARTETLFPLNPLKYEIPEDMAKSSERVMHFWLGAMSPMWLPFVAATSLGLGAWMMGRGMAKSGIGLDNLGDAPMFKGLLSVETAIDEGVAAPIHAFVEAESVIADKVLGDYSPSKAAIAAAYRAEAEAATAEAEKAVSPVETESVEVEPAEVEITTPVAPLPIAQTLAVAPTKPKSRPRRR